MGINMKISAKGRKMASMEIVIKSYVEQDLKCFYMPLL